MIEMLKDKTHLKTFEDHKDYRTENEINSEIVKFQDQQKNIVDQILALSHFAQIIRKNSICEMREFAQQADTYFKTHLYDLAQKEHVGTHKEEIKQKIEDRDITIHDFWREKWVLPPRNTSQDATDFDKKMTLLALMYSQILIVNTKGLIHDISDILEVSSYHLDALSQQDSKPRINFVLHDIKDARSAQSPAFCDIRKNLRKMFQEIPGCAFDMEDFMIVEEKDVHLLENAFSCSFDDFNLQSMITNNDNFYFPVSIWKEIDACGNFFYFKNSKDIQQWNAMKKIVSSYEETLLESYKVAGLKLIDKQTELNQWTKNDDIMFEKCLDQETNKYLSQALADFWLK
ncbi:4386_t:CDS:2, partial [Racocetra persica]